MLTRRLGAIFLLLAVPSAARAWGPEGHQVVALIAYAHLTPEARAGTKALLAEGRDIFDADVVDWADRIRSTHKELGPYHYVNADVRQRAIDLKAHGNGGRNVVDGIVNQIGFLTGDPKAKPIVLGEDDDEAKSDKPQTKAQALRFVIHFVGDVHQPLHCCDRNGDQGGNKVNVLLVANGRETNLHAAYDSGLLREYVRTFLAANRRKDGAEKMPGTEKDAPDITAYAMSLDAKISAAERKAWSAGTPLDWANESHVVAAREIYADLPKGDPVRLDARYFAKKQLVVEKQLARGGVRLAAVLNKAFAPASPTAPASRPSDAR